MPSPPAAARLADRAKDALRQGRWAEATAFVQRAVAAPPDDADALRTLSDVALILRDRAAAADLLNAAIERYRGRPVPVAWFRLLGERRAAQGKLGEAIRAFRAVLAQSPGDVDTWRWLARMLRAVNDLPAAVAACRKVAALAPEEWQAQNELGIVLTETRAFDEAEVAFAEASARAGAAPAVVVAKARLDAQLGRRKQAIAALEACVAHHPEHVPAWAALALALRDERRPKEAVTAFRRALSLAPSDATLACGLGRTLLEDEDGEEALAVAKAYLERHPGHAGALALEIGARRVLGDADGVARLLDYDSFVVARELPLPEGFETLAAFNELLSTLATTHPTLHRAPVSHATAEGLHSGSLLVDAPPVVVGLQAALRVAVADYCRTLPDLPGHPFVARQPKSAFFDIWCVVMERDGHQIPHIHPAAWLSGVYYPRVPEAVLSGQGHAGWLAFGKPDRDFPAELEPRLVEIRPREGLLVVFPSYFYHGTVPLETDGTRISVAFDLVPTDG